MNEAMDASKAAGVANQAASADKQRFGSKQAYATTEHESPSAGNLSFRPSFDGGV